ncbi:MAG TPA: signal peptidase II [Rubricoccaceae bacterium]|nr:signal peptidase II [Rubricoccaceae bacterium]
MRVLWAALAVAVVDQLTKVWVRTTMLPYESIPVVGDLFKLTFTENPGMAFGMTVGSKLFLTLFSILATGLIGFYLWHVRRGPWGYRLSLALILGGALGNIIDRVFYGVVWGYGPLLYGNVVDFLHLDLYRGSIPAEIPLVGGRPIALFPIGNVADLAIVGGVGAILLLQRRFHRAMEAQAAQATQPRPVAERVGGEAPVHPEPAATPAVEPPGAAHPGAA